MGQTSEIFFLKTFKHLNLLIIYFVSLP
jgi:hypothetical protein